MVHYEAMKCYLFNTDCTQGRQSGGGLNPPWILEGGVEPLLIFRKICVEILKSGLFLRKIFKSRPFSSLCVELLKSGPF